MNKITVPLSDESIKWLENIATNKGRAPEEVLGELIDQMIPIIEADDMDKDIQYLLNKNAELLRRLA